MNNQVFIHWTLKLIHSLIKRYTLWTASVALKSNKKQQQWLVQIYSPSSTGKRSDTSRKKFLENPARTQDHGEFYSTGKRWDSSRKMFLENPARTLDSRELYR
jgi:hypothetical protein